MKLNAKLIIHFFIRLIMGAVPMAFFTLALFSKGESGNNGIGLNTGKFIPVILLFAWGIFLLIEAAFLFSKQRISYMWSNVLATVILGIAFLLAMYMEYNI